MSEITAMYPCEIIQRFTCDVCKRVLDTPAVALRTGYVYCPESWPAGWSRSWGDIVICDQHTITDLVFTVDGKRGRFSFDYEKHKHEWHEI